MSRRPWLASPLVRFGAPALVVAATLGALWFRDYTATDPRFCGSCHEQRDEFQILSQGTHTGIVCQACHHTDRRQALAMMLAVVVGKGAKHDARVPQGACARCHETHDLAWPDVRASEGHRVHATAKVACERCHARGIHEFGIALDACKDCHEHKVVAASGMEKLHCTSCHGFTSATSSLKPDRAACMRCHASRVVLDTSFPEDAPMAKLACAACHKPHTDARASDVKCTTCHAAEETHGLHGHAGHETCADCHRDHSWSTDRATCLTRCHAKQAQHETGRECRGCHSFAPPTGAKP